MIVRSDKEIKITNDDIEIQTHKSSAFIPISTIDHPIYTRGEYRNGITKPDWIDLYTKEHVLIHRITVDDSNRAMRIYLEIIKELRKSKRAKGESHYE